MTQSDEESRRLAIKAVRDSSEERLITGIRPAMIPVDGGEPMVWTDHEQDEESEPGGRIQ